MRRKLTAVAITAAGALSLFLFEAQTAAAHVRGGDFWWNLHH